MSSPTFFSQHTYSDRLTDRDLAAEIEARIASTPWTWAFPFGKIEAIRLRLARSCLRGTVKQRLLLALASGAVCSLLSLISGALLAAVGLTLRRSLYHDLFITGFLGLWFSLISYVMMKVNGEATCYEVARELDAGDAAREPRT